MSARLARLARVLRASREQLVHSVLTLCVLIVGYLVAVEARGEPVRSLAVLLLLLAFAFLTGWLHEVHRPGGTFDLILRLEALDGLSVRDRRLLDRLLGHVSDHGGGQGRLPECELDECVSCQAAHLRDRLVVAS